LALLTPQSTVHRSVVHATMTNSDTAFIAGIEISLGGDNHASLKSQLNLSDSDLETALTYTISQSQYENLHLFHTSATISPKVASFVGDKILCSAILAHFLENKYQFRCEPKTATNFFRALSSTDTLAVWFTKLCSLVNFDKSEQFASNRQKGEAFEQFLYHLCSQYDSMDEKVLCGVFMLHYMRSHYDPIGN
jgi:hypothetical protein